MFTYCLNNPVNALDPFGEDAIWLQDTNNSVTGPLGHTGLLIQDEAGTWYYFNWASNNCLFYEVDSKIYDYSSIESLMTVGGNRYDTAIYLEGDFGASVEYATKLRKNFSRRQYNLWWNNCMQVSVDVLTKGKFAQSDASYKSFLQRIRYSTIPNVAYSRLFNFKSAVQTYYAVPVWARWLYISPQRAVLEF